MFSYAQRRVVRFPSSPPKKHPLCHRFLESLRALSDRELTLFALREAQLILADYLQTARDIAPDRIFLGQVVDRLRLSLRDVGNYITSRLQGAQRPGLGSRDAHRDPAGDHGGPIEFARRVASTASEEQQDNPAITRSTGPHDVVEGVEMPEDIRRLGA